MFKMVIVVFMYVCFISRCACMCVCVYVVWYTGIYSMVIIRTKRFIQKNVEIIAALLTLCSDRINFNSLWISLINETDLTFHR